MKAASWSLIFVVALICVLGIALPAAAEDGVIFTPSHITIAGTHGSQTERTVVLQVSSPITGLQVVTMDLTGADGVSVIPANAIQATLPTNTIPEGELLSFPIIFDLTNVPSGQFTGNLLLPYEEGTLTLPLTVTVKDPPIWPATILIIGVALGMGVSWYRSQGRPRDEILIQVGQLRTLMKADEALQQKASPFYNRIDAELVDVDVALQAKKWTEAQQAIEEAKMVWVRWRKGRGDWLRQLDYYESLLEQLKEQGENVFYMEVLLQNAQDAFHALPDLEGPATFSSTLATIATKLNTYKELYALISELGELGEPWRARARRFEQRLQAVDPGDAATYPDAIATLRQEIETMLTKAWREIVQAKLEALQKGIRTLSETEAQAWQDTLAAFEQRLNALQPGNREGYQALLQDLEAALREVASLQPTTRLAEEVSFAVPKAPSPITSIVQHIRGALLPPNVSPEAAIRAQTWEEQTQKASQRLRWFTWFSYLVAVLLLAGAGFGELYIAQPTFGSSPWGDYFTLLAWGFGAEATRASVTELVKQWGTGENEG